MNSLEKATTKILNIIEKKSATDSELINVIINSYHAVREDPSIIDDFYEILDIFYNALKPIGDKVYNRILSLIALKNDMVLQKQLSERQIDIYLEEVEYIISKQAAGDDWMFVTKIGECLAKIQYAYNLIDSKKNISNIFFEFMKNIVINNQFKSLILLFNNEEWPDSYSIGMLFYYYMFFKDEPKPKLNIFKVFHKNYFIVTFWKQFKINYYEMTKEEVEKEGYESYDFIYR